MQLSLVSPKKGKSYCTMEHSSKLMQLWYQPPAATILLLPELEIQLVFANTTTELRDMWIFNATLSPNATLPSVLSGVFAGQVTVIGSLGPATSYPSYILRLYNNSYISLGRYVTANVSQNASTATAVEVMQKYGCQIESTTAYRRIAYPSSVAALLAREQSGKVYLLHDAVSGIWPCGCH